MNTTRYSCQIALPGFGAQAQTCLANARVLIVGIGGLGCPAAQYLASAGIGTLGLADDDTVSVSNLHRQILYTPADTGKPKAIIAAQKLSAQNPEIHVVSHVIKVTAANVEALFAQYDVIIDGTDNFESRYLLNDAAVLYKKPLVYGAIYQFEGQVAVWNVLNTDGSRTPHYRDLFPEVQAAQIPNCSEGGVIPTLAGMIGCMQANEAIKYITKTGDLLAGKLLILDTQSMQSRIIRTGQVTKTRITQLPVNYIAESITVAKLKEAMRSGGNIRLIDIRSSEEHDEFNIGGLNIPAFKLKTVLADFKSSPKLIVLYCAVGRRSAEAVKAFAVSNPQLHVLSLNGGIKAWLQDKS